jgi:hypothetical protein
MVRCPSCGGLLMNSYEKCDICARKGHGHSKGRLPMARVEPPAPPPTAGQKPGLQRIRSEEYVGYSPYRRSRSPPRESIPNKLYYRP